MSNQRMEMTMETNNTPAPGAAMHTVMVAESRQRPLNPGEPIKFDTTLYGQPVVIRSTTPFFDTCRLLQAWDIAGEVEFVDAHTGTIRMTLNIAEGARRTVEEGLTGPRIRKYRPACSGEPMASGRKVDVRNVGSPTLSQTAEA